MKDFIIVFLLSVWLVTLAVMHHETVSHEAQIESCQDSLAHYRDYLETLRTPVAAPITDSLLVGNMFYNYAVQQVGFYRQALTDADAAALIPQTPECLAAYKWLREKRGYRPEKSIRLVIKWWERQ